MSRPGRRPLLHAVALSALAAVACGGAGSGSGTTGAPGMDEVGQAMVRLGEALRARGAALHERAAALPGGAAQEGLAAAGDRWLAEGEAVAAEGSRIVRAAIIVGQTTSGGRAPAQASRVVVFGIEAEADALLTTARRLEERSQTFRAAATALQASGTLAVEETAPLLADTEALARLAADARRAGEAMHEQVRRFRRGLGARGT